MSNRSIFEEYLIDRHAEQYQGLDDEMPEDFERWVVELSVDELIEYADKCIVERHMTAQAKIAELEAEVKKLQGQWEGTTAVLVKGTVSKEDWGYLHGVTQQRDIAEAKVAELRELIKVKDEALEYCKTHMAKNRTDDNINTAKTLRHIKEKSSEALNHHEGKE